MQNPQFRHIPVMPKEAIELLSINKNGIYVDGTLGGGGHSEKILEKLGDKGKLIGIDQDFEAITAAKKRLSKFKDKIIFVQDNFKNLDLILDNLKILKVDGIILDLGVSSYQVDNPKRGFSFKKETDAVLDMRMDQKQKLTAFDVVNYYSQEDLKSIFFELGEERYAPQIARAIVIRRQEKPIKAANDLLDVIRGATPPKYRFSRHGHFAAKIFRALRMEVNHELDVLHQVLPQAVDKLKKGGRLIVISFHSLEDRIVKHFFRDKKNEGIIEVLTKKPLVPTYQEIRLNPRAESAKLRAIEKI